jgi:hypothetical protein
MRSIAKLLIAAPVAAGLLGAPAAHADWNRHGGFGWHGGWRGPGWHGYEHRGPDPGSIIAGTVLGLGAAAALAGAFAPPPPPVYVAPPPVYYTPPPAYYAPAYPPPPAYYPGY